MTYIDNDGKAVTKKYGKKYYVRAQSLSEKIIFDKLQSAIYPFLGNKLTDLSYWMEDEKKIEEPSMETPSLINDISNCIDNCSGITDILSFIGDCDFSKVTNVLGKTASIVSYVQTGYEIIKELNKTEDTALESFCCSYLNKYLVSNSHENSSRLYIFAKSALANMYEEGVFTMEYNKDGDWTNYKINNKQAMDDLKSILSNMQKEMEGTNND